MGDLTKVYFLTIFTSHQKILEFLPSEEVYYFEPKWKLESLLIVVRKLTIYIY